MSSPNSPAPGTAGLLVLGGGNMARALLAGLKAPAAGHGPLAIVEPQAAAREQLGMALFQAPAGSLAASAELYADLDELRGRGPTFQRVLLAVKPQVALDVLSDLAARGAALLAPGWSLLSIAAGLSMSKMQAAIGHGRIVRAMPNTPAQIGQGISGLVAAPDFQGSAGAAALEALDAYESLLSSAGAVVRVETEAMLDAVTALSGSGPAYVFLFQEALEAAGIRLGLRPEQARALALQTLRGSAALMAQPGAAEPATLRAQVTSPGGTTAAALAVFEAGGFRELVADALAAAQRRAQELSQG